MLASGPGAPRGVQYLKDNGVEDLLVKMLMDLGKLRPADPFAYVLDVLSKKTNVQTVLRGSQKVELGSKNGEEVNENVVSFVREWQNVRPEGTLQEDEQKKSGADQRAQSMVLDSVAKSDEDFETRQKRISVVIDWNYEVLNQTTAQLVQDSILILEAMDIVTRFNVQMPTLTRFCTSICNNYRERNPYHNFKHAFSVMQGTCLLLRAGARIFLEDVETYAMLIAALAHDVGHPGMNNDYFIKARHDLAYRYNDIAVLENMHAALTFELMNMPNHNICETFESDEEWRSFRRVAICAILATDMKVHFELTAKLANLGGLDIAVVGDEGKQISETPEYRELIQKCVVHAADLSNPVLPTKQCEEWAYRVVVEFYQQAQAEKEEGLPFAPFMENHPDNLKDLANLQIGFINFIVKPFWSSWPRIFSDLGPQYDQLIENLDHWTEIKRKFEDGELMQDGTEVRKVEKTT